MSSTTSSADLLTRIARNAQQRATRHPELGHLREAAAALDGDPAIWPSWDYVIKAPQPSADTTHSQQQRGRHDDAMSSDSLPTSPSGSQPDPELSIAQERHGPSGVLVVSISGEIDLAAAPAVRACLHEAIGAGASRLVIDLSAVSFLDSSALAAILAARMRLADAGHMAVVVSPGSYVRLVLEIAGMPACLDLFDTRDAAIAHLTALTAAQAAG
jgi:anti-sigma B factor antagonist